MTFYSRESLELLRQKIDLIEVLQMHVKLKKSGAYYKAVCPFHDEKTPSFTVQSGDSHYHCFGCGAHGDAIAFLMSYAKMSFAEAVEHLAERFQVPLKQEYEKDESYAKRSFLRECLGEAAKFYHFFLLHTDEGQNAQRYLFQRGIDLEFIKAFQVGLAPKKEGLLLSFMKEMQFDLETLKQTGLLNKGREFFLGRILFPILDPLGHVIGFSGRKIQENSFGPKYINTPETMLFKKSQVLFGFSHSRRRIAKEKRAIIVEGQIDALRLIQEGLNLAVAGQGTAFGEGQAKELLKLGVKEVYLALDADNAGREAAIKIGDMLQSEGVEVLVASFPEGEDPDKILQKEGVEGFINYLKNAWDYLSFLVKTITKNIDLHSPAKKNRVVEEITARIRNWNHPLIIHESLRKLAKLLEVPEDIIQVPKVTELQKIPMQKFANLGHVQLDPDRILETDLLRWMFLKGEDEGLIKIIGKNLAAEDFKIPICRRLFQFFFSQYQDKEKSCDLLNLAINIEKAEDQLFLSDLLQKKVNLEKARPGVIEAIEKILHRNWMDKRESIKKRIQKQNQNEEEIMILAKEFDSLAKTPPQVILDDD
ncbi:MAG: DNA primase [Simkaniaceae bacterium]